MSIDRPQRNYPAKHSRLHLDNRSIILFLTVCTKNRKATLARPEIHQLLLQSWLSADSWSIGRYTILPDHIHLFCTPNQEDALNIKRWVSYWKSLASRNWPFPEQKPIWQRNCWDRQIRNTESWQEKWEYVRCNPVRHRLIKNAADWPYQGEITPLLWHNK